ncbi:hypothetical protein [Nocardioides jiangxiensis]|uniref:Uncharacterized protein n=1 Tax=Nocardioides jiangxiensis TaxID=3064524 RepID=A0ABT9B2I4_9ACTN|nr:hypothetical protein [Nocardioides sp. WY-20]MDO7869067.1 hypothetical protein [Nocardioides sp. WY-20]
MDASHARPLTAYAALCAAAVVVLVQGISPGNPVADSVARAGGPAPMYDAVRSVSLAAKELGHVSSEVASAVAGTVVPAVVSVVPVSGPHTASGGGHRAATTGHASAAVTVQTVKHAGPAVSVAPRSSGPTQMGHHQAKRATAHTTAQAQRKADHAAAKTRRAAAKADRKPGHAATRAAQHPR